MIILIDGYNLLKQIFPHVKGQLKNEREVFIRQLGCYKQNKADKIKEIILVFDAGPFSHATREIKNGVVVMFSGQDSTADDWIIEYVEKHRNEELLVVSNDRKIITTSQTYNAATLGSNDFYEIMQNVLFSEHADVNEFKTNLTSVIKKNDANKYANEELDQLSDYDKKKIDFLMETSCLNINKVEDLQNMSHSRQKNNSVSKKDKKLYSKLKKLYCL